MIEGFYEALLRFRKDVVEWCKRALWEWKSFVAAVSDIYAVHSSLDYKAEQLLPSVMLIADAYRGTILKSLDDLMDDGLASLVAQVWLINDPWAITTIPTFDSYCSRLFAPLFREEQSHEDRLEFTWTLIRLAVDGAGGDCDQVADIAISRIRRALKAGDMDGFLVHSHIISAMISLNDRSTKPLKLRDTLYSYRCIRFLVLGWKRDIEKSKELDYERLWGFIGHIGNRFNEEHGFALAMDAIQSGFLSIMTSKACQTCFQRILPPNQIEVYFKGLSRNLSYFFVYQKFWSILNKKLDRIPPKDLELLKSMIPAEVRNALKHRILDFAVFHNELKKATDKAGRVHYCSFVSSVPYGISIIRNTANICQVR